jgi:signal transduction histidine kinase
MAASLREELVGHWSRYAVGVIGALLLGAGAGSVLLDGRVTGGESVRVAGLVAVTVALMAVGSRVATDLTDADETLRVLGWLGGGVLAFAVLGGWLSTVTRSGASAFGAALVFLTVLAAGALFGATVGYYDVRVRRLAAAAGRERARREFLGEQQEALSTLTGILRHQVRNDLAAISGRTELLAADRIDRATAAESVLAHCEHIDATVDRIETLMDVLAATTDAGPVPLAVALERACDRLQEAHGVTVQPPETDATVYADDLLYLALYELLDNAVVHGGRPRLSVDRAGEGVVVAVTDDGPGPAPEPGKLFEPNARGPDSDGDGLGLFLAELLLDRYGGTVRLAGTEPTRFELRVPAATDA